MNILTNEELTALTDALRENNTENVNTDLQIHTLKHIKSHKATEFVYYYKGLLFFNKDDAFQRMMEDVLYINKTYMLNDDNLSCYVENGKQEYDFEILELSIR